MNSLKLSMRHAARSPSRTQARRPLRLWMTGSLAVVMAALLPSRSLAEALADAERAETQRVIRHSRYGVIETVQRLEDAALTRGLSVLARLSVPREPVIVLASSVGGTLVVMDEATERVQMPFCLQVRAGEGGGAEILLPALAAPQSLAEWLDVPERVVADLALLPAVIEQAAG